MSEGTNSEHKDEVTYEQVVAAMKLAQEAGVTSPDNDQSPVSLEAMRLLSQYDEQEIARCKAAPDPARAKIEWGIKRNMLWVDAGFKDYDRTEEALDWIKQDYDHALELGDPDLAARARKVIEDFLKSEGKEDKIEEFFDPQG